MSRTSAPSIAIQQSNTVKTSRSTVGTITELCDYFKVWFANVATLCDPATRKPIRDDNPQSIWKQLISDSPDESVLVCFEVKKVGKLKWSEILQPPAAKAVPRTREREWKVEGEKEEGSVGPHRGPPKKNDSTLTPNSSLFVIQDRISDLNNRARFLEAAQQAFTFGKGRIALFDTSGNPISEYTSGLTSPETGKTFRAAIPSTLFVQLSNWRLPNLPGLRARH